MKNSEYWKKRFELLEQSQHQKGIQCYADIERQYRHAQKQIEGQISAWYQRFAKNNGITLADARKMLTNRELEELKWDIHDYIRYGKENAINGAWVKQLENASARYHISRLEALKLQTQQSIEVLFGNQLDGIDSAMRDIYKSGYYHTAFEIQKGVGVGWDFATLDDKTISKVINKPWAVDGKNFSERVWGNRQKLVNELNTELTRNVILGQDPQKAIDAISRKMKASKNVTGRLVMTEEAFFSSAAQKDCFNELDVELFEIVATLDSHTSEICQEMDGKVFPMSQWEVGVTAPPFHVWCRTTTVPAFGDEFDNIGERAARGEDGKIYYVPANMKYEDWQKSFVEGDKTGLQEMSAGDIMQERGAKFKSVENVSDFEELRQYMHETYDIDMDNSVTHLDFNTVRDSLTGVESVILEYPEVGDLLKTIKTSNSGVMSCAGSTISFNKEYYNIGTDLADKCYIASQMGAWVKKCSPKTIGAHEAGHGVEWLLIQSNIFYEYAFERTIAWNECSEAKSIVNEAIKNIKKTEYGKGKKKADLIKGISQYALDSDSETLAEAFQDVYANGKEANPLSLEIKKITKQRMNHYKEAD